ncbi:trihelix transcription factor GTL1-like [Pyrus ussuriensis x Pyrus communis]|uniref:Trihelix transcription factor GTL1-like n=1 Tax=Pyrus ussuriensis x Pyrus communis TaxID=2448454 RepID=A0A5N5IEF0_9ROSA|nr:trihelix transcription factor GTL1-like [Pyrus ussuriensis x Pyrus communis]
MAELTGGRHLPNPDAFGEQISPFPESTYDLVFENPTPAVPSPPQKLRPVRGGGGRSPMDSGGKLEDVGPAKVGSGDELEDESSSSADDDDDRDKCLKAQGEEPMKRKRKTNVRTGNRLEIERVELFLESLVKKVMEQQEQMHKQLIEVIEKNEKERLAREEAWKQQVLDRLKRDKEIRAQETSRSLALISFIQNYLGSENQVPQPSPSPSPEMGRQTMACTPKGRIWEEISVKMGEMGYVRSGRKCREKWENINKYFRRCMGPDSKRSANAKLCPYFHELELLHKSGLVSFGNGFNRTSNQNEAKIEKEEQKSEKRSDDGLKPSDINLRQAEMNQYSMGMGRQTTATTNVNNVFNNNNVNHPSNANTTNGTADDNECMVREQDRFMPIANVIRIMRKILPPHAKISDDAKETIQECVSEYISFITGEANERCQREQRKTITAEDVLWAMSKLGFDDYIEPLTLYLHRYREMEGERGSSTTSLMRSESLAKGAGTSSGTSSRAIDHHQYYGTSMAAAAAAFHHQHGHGLFGYMQPSDVSVSNNNANAAAASGSSSQLQGGGSAAMPNGDHHQPHANGANGPSGGV